MFGKSKYAVALVYTKVDDVKVDKAEVNSRHETKIDVDVNIKLGHVYVRASSEAEALGLGIEAYKDQMTGHQLSNYNIMKL